VNASQAQQYGVVLVQGLGALWATYPKHTLLRCAIVDVLAKLTDVRCRAVSLHKTRLASAFPL